MPSKRDFKSFPAVTHLRERVQKQDKPDGIGGVLTFPFKKRLRAFFLLRFHGMMVCSRKRRRRGRFPLMKRTLIGLLRSHEQTGDRAKDPQLKSRIYKLSKEKTW